jgi:hypothetical protein
MVSLRCLCGMIEYTRSVERDYKDFIISLYLSLCNECDMSLVMNTTTIILCLRYGK